MKDLDLVYNILIYKLKLMKRIITFLVIFLTITPFFAQSQNLQPKHQITTAKFSGKTFKDVSLFRLKTSKSNVSIPKEFKNHTILSLQSSAMKSFTSAAPEAINLALPGKTASMQLELVKVDIVSDNFSIVEMPSGKVIKPTQKMAHYRGIVKNSPNSIAALTILDGEISGIISLEDEIGNLVLGKLDHSKDHILYEDKDISHLNDFLCHAKDSHSKEMDQGSFSDQAPVANQVKCPEIFFDIGNDIVRDRGSAQGASSYIQAIFNQVAILYNNEDVNIKISGVRAWTSSTPFNSLDGFRSYRNQNGFDGDLAHFVTYNYSGGVAWLNALCGSRRYGLSGINRSYNNVPRYSWTVNVIAHELGHNFGSNHTHSCAWNGNNTAIDGCYNTEGGCGRPGIPSNGGTIMSYCHLTNTGVNLNKGFGRQPGDVIRRTIARSSCVGTCDGDGGGGGGDEVNCAGVDEWSANASYSAGDRVVYQGNLFERNSRNDGWNTIGTCSTNDPCAGVAQWSGSASYSPGDLVIYQGNLFRRNANNDGWDSLGACETNNDPCFGVDAWSANANYSAGDRVVYQGNLFERNSRNDGWNNLGACGNAARSLAPGEIAQLAKSTNITIYPNPAKDILHIEANHLTSTLTNIVIKDMNGRILKTILPQKNPNKLSIKQTINVDHLAAGVYFIQMVNSNKIVTKKFFIK